MRILMWLTIGFAAACAASIYLGAGILFAVLYALPAVVFLLLKRRFCKVLAVVLIGATLGSVWTCGYSSIYLKPVKSYDGQTANAVAVISDYSYETNYGIAADCNVDIEGKTYKARLYLEDGKPLAPGDKISGEFRFRMTTADSLQGETHHQGEGVFWLIYADKDSTVEKAGAIPLKFYPAKIRKEITGLLCSAFPEDTAPFITALILGDSSMLDYTTDTDFKLSGIRHIIAVSGLHVSILMSVVYLFFSRRRVIAAVVGIPVLIFFAAVVGFTPSVTRACIMQIIILLGMAMLQEYDAPTSLSTAVLIMLLVNPWTITSVSFQLSTGCLIGIFLFYKRICNYFARKLKMGKLKTWKDKLLYGICSSTAITLSTTVVTTPLSAAYFGTVSLVGVVTNLLTLWVITFIFCGGLLCCIAGLIWMPLAKVMALVVSVPIRYVMGVARILADLPHSAVYTCSIYIVIWLVMCYLLFGVFLLCKRKRPVLLLSGAAIGLVLALLLSWAEPRGSNYRITFFDVGNGQSILIECDDQMYLIDCGGDNDTTAAEQVVHHLRSRSISSVNGVIVTHYDRDHAGGVPLFLSEIKTQALYLPDTPDAGGIYRAKLSSYDTANLVSACAVIETEQMKITMIPGSHDALDNERSICVLFQTENCAILITGDRSTVGEKVLLQDVSLPEVDILVAGHHGAKTSTGMELLSAVRPKIVVLSLAEDNFYGHPSDEVLYRLELFRCKIFRTDRDGTIIFTG